MSPYYLDSSALVKRYMVEIGSAWVRGLTARRSGNLVYASVIGQPEVISALQRKVREGHLDARHARALSRRIATHFIRSYALVAITPAVIAQSCDLLERYRLRAYDAVQLACALAVRTVLQQNALPGLVFVAADDDLLTVATAEGFAVENPLLHS